tara:strand:+ start:9243 stop:9884 length:642 start_codon:yes stop_codon:yes gene_type:complete
MPERVTREEKTVELAILKARETLGALRDGENTELDIVKLRRPKAQASTHGIKQNQIHANAGGESFTSGKIKKSFDKKKMVTALRAARQAVLVLDAKVEQLMSKGAMNEEDTKSAKSMKKQADAAEKVLSDLMGQLSRNKGGFGDFKKDDRGVEFTEAQQKNADAVLEQLNSTIREMSSKLPTATTKQLVKYEADLKEAVSDLKGISKYFGRSS